MNTPSPRILFLQNSSLFEGFGGIEYYQDDWLSLAADIWGSENVVSIVALRRKSTQIPKRSYGIRKIPFRAPSPIRFLENRFSPFLFSRALSEIYRLKPTLIVAGHLSLAPMAYALSRLVSVPFGVIAYGIECWGGLLPQDKWALGKASSIFSISHWTREQLLRQGFSDKKIKVVHPILPPSLERKIPARKEKGPFTLLTISRLSSSEQYKGQDHVLQALSLLRNLDFKYVIQGEGSDRARLEIEVKRLGLQEKVEFRGGAKDRAEFESSYREADLYVMPSRFGKWNGRWKGEGFGIVYVEAAALGVPSLAYRCGGVLDIVEHGKTGWLVPPDDIASLAKAIEKLAQDRAFTETLGKNAYAHVNSRFARKAVGEEMIEALGTHEARPSSEILE